MEWTYISPAIELNLHSSHDRRRFYRTELNKPIPDKSQKGFITVDDLAVAILDEVAD